MVAVRRIVVGVHGSLGSLQALRFAAEEARERHVVLVAAIAWMPPGGDLAERTHPSPNLRQVWRDAARQRLLDAFDNGLGGLPHDIYCLAHAKCPVLAVPPSALMDEMGHSWLRMRSVRNAFPAA